MNTAEDFTTTLLTIDIGGALLVLFFIATQLAPIYNTISQC